MYKNKKIIIACFCGVCLILLIFCWLKLYSNHFFGNWAQQTFITTNLDDQTGLEVSEFNWIAFKFFSQLMFLVILIVTSAIILVISNHLKKKKEKETITLIAKQIQLFMEHESMDENFFPANYSDIAFQMLQIKDNIKTKQEELAKETKQKHDLITYLAHDLKTPLASVIGYLNLLNDVQDLPREQRLKYTAIALEKADRLEQLVNEFFEISRYNLHDLSLNETKIDLTMLLSQVVDEFFPLTEKKQQKIEMNITKKVMIYGEADKLSRVFNNIFKNAIVYGNEHSTIHLTLEVDIEQVVIAISNECPLLTEYQLKKIFQKFYRADQSRSTETGGSGLGLAIAKQIIEAHKGEITAESNDERTRFVVKLPLEKN